jgi:manganese oxidase
MRKVLAALIPVALTAVVALAISTAGNGARGTTRTYFVAADEVAWDYAPSGINEITGQPFDDEANVFVRNGPNRIGKTYIKAIYREYTDATFTTLKQRPADQRYLGLLGPVLRGEVGDTIRVVFRNNLAFPASMHPHGMFYDKASEGAGYADGTSTHADDAVTPGGTYTYTWQIPERAGPGPGDPSSVLWMYHSHVNEPRDANSGLVGPIIVTRAGEARADGTPKDVDREFVTMFVIVDENDSWYIDRNIQTYAGRPATVNPDDDDFIESNLMHSINGFVFGNMPLPTMRVGEHVRWYLLGMGNEVDLHTPHWHGNVVLVNGMRTDVVELLPASMKVADMVPDNLGIWLYHCHVNDHIKAGMLARFRVTS